MDILIFGMLFLAGLLAGVSNAVAGGGTFFSFPAFLAAGLPPIVANASNCIAVWPANALAVVGYRNVLRQHARGTGKSIFIALLGGGLGAAMLVFTGNAAFVKLIPFLILFATLLFTFGSRFSGLLASYAGGQSFTKPGPFSGFLLFIFAFYGGFFGAGLGIMLIAGLHMLGVHDIQANNALKNLLAAAATSIALVIFTFSGIVAWPYALVAFAGAVMGGLLGSRIAQWLPAIYFRRVVIVIGMFLSIYYFIKYYG